MVSWHAREYAPMPLNGHLLKQRPRLGFRNYQRRLFNLEDGRLSWTDDAGANDSDDDLTVPHISRHIDLAANLCEVKAVDGHSTRLVLKPLSEKWQTGAFTGVRRGRVFNLDTAGSEHSREQWLAAIQEHIAFGCSRGVVVASFARSRSSCVSSSETRQHEFAEFGPQPSHRFRGTTPLNPSCK
mmetsp:Transcript_99268/g.155223  ORF Transcript_99268/g.155223 Transcript_99268/m.155223 type:complete len:184 (+) Transcript_99268:72-623(+)